MKFSGEKVISKKYGIGYAKGEPEENKIKVEFKDGREAIFSTNQSFALDVVRFENEELNEYVKGLSDDRKKSKKGRNQKGSISSGKCHRGEVFNRKNRLSEQKWWEHCG